jgi:hypothetical protein
LNIVILTTIIAITGCTKDKALRPSGNITLQCDSIAPSYNNCIKPVFKYYCYQCHSDSASLNGSIAFDIEDFAQLKTYMNLYYRNDSIYGSKFSHIIEGSIGVIPMPPSGRIPASKISLINQWIEQGAVEN